MEGTRNLCAQIPISLHDMVREEKEALGLPLSEYVTNILKEHFEGGQHNMANEGIKTLAFQISASLDQRIKKIPGGGEGTYRQASQPEGLRGGADRAGPGRPRCSGTEN